MKEIVIRHPHNKRVITATAPELGFVLSAEETIQAAPRFDWREATRGDQLWGLINRHTTEVIPVVQLDSQQTERYLTELAQNNLNPPQNGSIRFDNRALTELAPKRGYKIDVQQTRLMIEATGSDIFYSNEIELVTETIQPEIGPEVLDAAIATLNRRLETDLVLTLYDPVRDDQTAHLIPKSIWHSWLTLQWEPQEVIWEVDMQQVADFVESLDLPSSTHRIETAEAISYIRNDIVKRLDGETIDDNLKIRLYHHETQHIVGPGETFSSIAFNYGMPYPWLQAANPGIGDNLNIGQSITIPSPDLFLPLPIVSEKRIIVSLSEQKLWAYENGEIKWDWVISTGISSSPTSPGIFQIRSHEENAYAGNWDLWMPNFMGIYQPVPGSDFMNGFHGFPTRNGSNLLWTNSLGTPVTYGCVLVGNEKMAQLYAWGEAGVVVEIQP